MSLVPKKIFFVKGKGFSTNSELRSFEQALRDAGIEKFNIVKVSSIIPPHCEEVSKEEGLKELKVGQIVYSVMSRISSNKKNKVICASIGVAKPVNEEDYGYLSEKHSIDIEPRKVAKRTKELAAEMLVTTHGFSYDPQLVFSEKTENFKLNEKTIELKSITESALINLDYEWATVMAAAIFIV